MKTSNIFQYQQKELFILPYTPRFSSICDFLFVMFKLTYGVILQYDIESGRVSQLRGEHVC